VKWSQEQTKFLKKAIVVAPATEVVSNTEGLVEAMSQFILKEG
jgi:hypothetical protein